MTTFSTILDGQYPQFLIESTSLKDGKWLVKGKVKFALSGSNHILGSISKELRTLEIPFQDAVDERHALEMACEVLGSLATTFLQVSETFGKPAQGNLPVQP